MQVFITSSDPYECASNLDTRRLLKQVVECATLINIIEGSHRTKNSSGRAVPWINHPVTRMWRPYLDYLKFLQNCYNLELRRRKTQNGHDFRLKSPIFDQIPLPEDVAWVLYSWLLNFVSLRMSDSDLMLPRTSYIMP